MSEPEEKTERESGDGNIFLLEAAGTNLSSPLGKTFPSLSHFKDICRKESFRSGQTEARGGCAVPLPRHGPEAPCSPRLRLASFLCPQRNPRGSAASPAHVRLAPLPGGCSAAARWPRRWLLQPTRKWGTGRRGPSLFNTQERKHQGRLSMYSISIFQNI